MIAVADHVIDLGPGAGAHGGEVVFQGEVEALLASDTLTGRHLNQARPLKEKVREPRGGLAISGATLHNLKNLTVSIPLGVFTVVTGVAGSGKSTLINEVFLQQHPDAIVVGQSRVGLTAGPPRPLIRA